MNAFFRFSTMALGLIFLLQPVMAQVTYTANDSVVPFTGYFRSGSNMGTYTGFKDTSIAVIGAGNGSTVIGVGAKAMRPLLPDYFLEQYGYDARVTTFQRYGTLGMNENTVIVGFPSEPHRDTSHYCPGIQSELFANMYLPIWDNGANGTPYNDSNYYASYVYRMVNLYKDNVKFWEIWNEPGYDYTGNLGWQLPGVAGNWWQNNPNPCDYKLRAPIFHYVRLLRISWEVIKTVDPDAYVCASGLGYESFCDAVCRNTDNPIDGSATADYPLGGGAYFDCIGFHSYPHFDGSLREWSNTANAFVYYRHSDRAASGLVQDQTSFQNVLNDYGYDGVTHPKKQWIVTEANLPRKQIGSYIGSAEAQRNFIIKAVVNAMKFGFTQIDWYTMGEKDPFATATNPFKVMGLYEPLNIALGLGNQIATDEGKANKTTTDLLYSTRYDAIKTAAMQLPSGVDGGAFIDTLGKYTYVIWAKTQTDMSEVASATYTFPAALGLTSLIRYEWNYGYSGTTATSGISNIALTGSPSFFREAPCTTPVQYFADTDGDGFGSNSNQTLTCTPPTSGFVTNCGDCDDTNANIHPNAVEISDAADNDCNGIINDVCTNINVIRVAQQSPTSVALDWDNMNDANNYNIQTRPAGTLTWGATTTTVTSFMELSGLTEATPYEIRVRTKCNGTFTPYSTTPLTFTTAPAVESCLKPVISTVHMVSNFTARIFWNSTYSALKYGIRYRPNGTTTWTTTSFAGPANRSIANLLPGTTYQYQVRALCPPGAVANWTTYSTVGTFTMPAVSVCSPPALFVAEPTNTTGSFMAIPNPTDGQFRISLDTDAPANLTLHDMQGRHLYQWHNIQSADLLSVQDFPPGIYLLSATLPDGTKYTTQIIRL